MNGSEYKYTIAELGVGMQQSAWWYGVGITWLLAAAGHRFFYLILRWFRQQ
jgi:hypothetical protein